MRIGALLGIALALGWCCGGPAALDNTNQAYESRQRVRREPLMPPYHIPESKYENPLVSWREAEGADGAHYRAYITAYVSLGMISRRDIYLAVDADGDGGYDEVLLTGLRDFDINYMSPTGDHFSYDSNEPLLLEVNGDEIMITHHYELEPKSHTSGTGADAETGQEPDGESLQTSILSLTELRRDSDGDGLTDIIEAQLLIDPHNPDSDGDGIEDYYDLQPGVNSATMGRLERGIARALSYSRQQGQYQFNYDGEEPAHPWSALYLEIEGAGDVAYSDLPYSFGVCITSPEAEEQYQQLVGADYGGSIHIIVVDLSTAQPGKEVVDWDFTAPEWFTHRADTPAGCEYVILLGSAGSAEGVYLVDIEGELYPVKWEGILIS